jgi:hypothetical protein
VDRQALDDRVVAGDEITGEDLKAVLTGESPPEGELLLRYGERLLRYALDARDLEAASLAARLMDANPELDETLNQILTDTLETQPDAVYAFIRARLGEGLETRWLPRLKSAAERSIQVAISDGDTETILNWLTLIAREPATYGLVAILHHGILEAQERARQDGELGRQLILFSAKRDPAALDILLADKDLVAILPDNSGRLLREYEGDPLALLQTRGVEIFLVALARAARVGAGTLFTPLTVAQVWSIYKDGANTTLPAYYQPESIVRELITRSADLTDETLDSLLTLLLAEKRDDWFYEVVHHLKGRETLVPLLAASLQKSQRTVLEILDLVGKLTASADLTQQQALWTYILLLTSWEWAKTALPVMEQVGRILQQNPTLALPADAIWHLSGAAAEAKQEMIMRVAARRLVPELELISDEPLLIDELLRLWNQAEWSAHTRHFITGWWRDFVRSLQLNQLQRLDKGLAGKRDLEELRTVVQTAIGFRRMLGHRSLKEFADAINSTFAILGAMAESFESTAKRQVNFDPETLRAELDAREGELSPHERRILSNNLKELAQLISIMGDSRSKANIMRRSDELDRDLMSGEQKPHSAVDTMKWLAGYWSGAHGKDEESAE